MPLINPTPDFSNVAGVILWLSYWSTNHAHEIINLVKKGKKLNIKIIIKKHGTYLNIEK